MLKKRLMKDYIKWLVKISKILVKNKILILLINLPLHAYPVAISYYNISWHSVSINTNTINKKGRNQGISEK